MHGRLRLAHGFRVGRKRGERIMREHGWAGSMKHKKKWGKANAATNEHRVNRNFSAHAANQLWFTYITDVTEHHTEGGRSTAHSCSGRSRAWRSVGRFPREGPLTWSSTNYRWLDGVGSEHAARSCTRTTEARADSTGRRNTLI